MASKQHRYFHYCTYCGFPQRKKKQHFIYTYIISLLTEGFPLTEWGHKNNYTVIHNFLTYWGFLRLRGRLSWCTCCPPWIQCLCCPHSKYSRCGGTVGFYRVYVPPDRDNWSLCSSWVVHQAISLQENL